MKKFLAFILATIMLFSFAACGSGFDPRDIRKSDLDVGGNATSVYCYQYDENKEYSLINFTINAPEKGIIYCFVSNNNTYFVLCDSEGESVSTIDNNKTLKQSQEATAEGNYYASVHSKLNFITGLLEDVMNADVRAAINGNELKVNSWYKFTDEEVAAFKKSN